MIFNKVALSALATGALLLGAVSPVFAQDTLTISGNGEGSSNTATITSTSSNTVSQNNDAHISNNVDSNATSGNNTAAGNTNGNVTVSTGAASTTTTVSNTANVNSADLSGTNSGGGDSNVTISGNGEDSHNTAALSNTGSTTQVFQNNCAGIHNNVDSNATTGSNNASGNTGGNVGVTTGSASTTTNVTNNANSNVAQLGGTSGNSSSDPTNATISGNGGDSVNSIGLTNLSGQMVSQNNHAYVHNNVDSNATSGNNIAAGNTNGMVTIGTGMATTNTTVGNNVNFNAAETDSLLTDVTASVTGNGEDSNNAIAALLGNVLTVYQGGQSGGNMADLHNPIDSNATSGSNVGAGNTGSTTGGIDAVITGPSYQATTVSNQANANIYGSGLDLTLPTLPSNFPFSFNFSFNMGGLFGIFS